jgi:hypothetical protein
VVALTTGVVMAAIACTTGPGNVLKGDPTTIVHNAASLTLAAGTAQVDVTIGVATGPGMAGTGLVDFGRQRADMTFQRTGSEASTGDRFELIVDGTDGFLSGVQPPQHGHPSFISGALPDLAQVAHDRITPLDSLLVRPGAGTALALLRGATKVLPYGGEEVQGTSTLRYSFVVDLTAAANASPVGQQPALETANQAIGDILEPADVWIDASGRVRQLQFATDPKLRTTTTKGNLLGITEDGEYLSFIIIDFSRFGEPAPINVPTIPGLPAP